MRTKGIISSVVLMLFIPSALMAQSIFSTTELYRSVRSVGMGATSAASEAGAFSVYDNASKTVFSNQTTELGIQYSPWAKGLTSGMDKNNTLLNFGGYRSFNEKHTLLFGASAYLVGGNKMYETDNDGNVVGDEIKPKFISVSLGYAYKLSDNWGLAAVANYNMWSPGIGDGSSAFGMDVTATRRFEMKRSSDYLDLSFKASSWGIVMSDNDNDKMPGNLSVAGLYSMNINDSHKLNYAAEIGYQCLDNSSVNGSLGIEYGYRDFVFLRGGYRYVNINDGLNNFISVGLGVKPLKFLSVDFAMLVADSDSPLKNTYMLGLGVNF